MTLYLFHLLLKPSSSVLEEKNFFQHFLHLHQKTQQNSSFELDAKQMRAYYAKKYPYQKFTLSISNLFPNENKPLSIDNSSSRSSLSISKKMKNLFSFFCQKIFIFPGFNLLFATCFNFPMDYTKCMPNF